LTIARRSPTIAADSESFRDAIFVGAVYQSTAMSPTMPIVFGATSTNAFVIIGLIVVIIIFLILFLVFAKYFRLWIQSVTTGAGIGL
jgi:hypothetical protein